MTSAHLVWLNYSIGITELCQYHRSHAVNVRQISAKESNNGEVHRIRNPDTAY
jgi:hypothetical protein